MSTKSMKTKKTPAATNALLKAVGRFAKQHGGNVLVAGPVQVIRWPDDRQFQFTIGIRCVGRVPTIKP